MKEIHDRIFPTLDDSCLSYKITRLWVNEFKRDIKSKTSIKTSGGLRTAVMPELIDKVHDMALSDRRVKMREISEVSQLSEYISL